MSPAEFSVVGLRCPVMRQEVEAGGVPTGMVTFLFTDVEGSTRLWQEHPEAKAVASARHDELFTGGDRPQ